MAVGSLRTFVLGILVAATVSPAPAQTPARPPIGDFGSPPDAMIFYVAHGAVGSCGPGCSDWIAAEGTVQWDTYKRLINILDRQGGKKLPLVINARGPSDLKVSASMGRILHDRGIDTTEGATDVAACAGKTEADCFALKRPGGPLEATLNTRGTTCDITCVLILAGGVHRTLPAGTRVILSGTAIHNRLAPNIDDKRRDYLTLSFDADLRAYLREMEIGTEVMDIVDQNTGLKRSTELPASDWTRLHRVTSAPR
jgi:hypothetical protein